MNRVLIAGIGNIFFGDDAFGCEVIRALSNVRLSPEVEATDFGIRSYDLAFALGGNYQAIILVDACPRGHAPGTVFLLEIDLAELHQRGRAAPDPHRVDAAGALQMALSFGAVRAKVYLVGCEPAALENHSGDMGLSPEVQRALPQAMEMISTLVNDLIKSTTSTKAGLAPAGKASYETKL